MSRPPAGTLHLIPKKLRNIRQPNVHTVSFSRPDAQEVAAVRRVYAVVGTGDPESRLKQYDACRSVAWFVRHNVSGKIRVASSRCGLRWCPLCVKSRRFAIVQSVSKWMTQVKQPKFLTLTLKHSNAPLPHQIDSLYKAFKELKTPSLVQKSRQRRCLVLSSQSLKSGWSVPSTHSYSF